MRSWVVIGSLRARKGAALGGIRRGNTRVEVPPKSRRCGSDPKNATKKWHRISNGFWTPKCSQKPPKMNPKYHQNPLFFRIRFHPVFFLIFGCFLACFDRRPTLDLIGIYSKFVGCSIFRKAWKSNQNDLQKYTKNPPKSLPKAIKNRCKNRGYKKYEKSSKNDVQMEPKGLPKFPRKSQEPPPKRPRIDTTA